MRRPAPAAPDEVAETAPLDAAHNDPKALRQQIAVLLPELRGFARFLARDPSLADDLVQETIARGLTALAQFRPGTDLKAWLFTIARNLFYEQARRRRHEARVLEQNAAEVPIAAAPHVERRQAVEELQRLLWQLSPLLREALVLVGAQEMSLEQAAMVCDVPVGTMKARVSRARAQLAQLAGAAAAGVGSA